MIDLHCHMLPGIDDGPKTMEQSIAMAKFAVENGIQRCVVTPHIQPGYYDNDITNISAIFALFQANLLEQGIDLNVAMAAEVRVCGELPMLISRSKIPFLGHWKGKKVILLEFPHDHIPVGADKLIGWLLDRDILPLIAHPERNQAIMRQPDKVQVFTKLGCLLQITASSITGLFGTESQKCALSFIQDGIVSIIATDAHNLIKRQPTMQAAKSLLLPLIGEKRVDELMVANPLEIIS